MVKKIKIEEKIYYKCEECNLIYLNNKLAKKCQAWCFKHKSCNLEIIKHALKGFKK